MTENIVKNNFVIKKGKTVLNMRALEVNHGLIKASGFLFEKIAYISDCNRIPKNSLKYLYNLNYLIIDCLKKDPHPSHFNYSEAIEIVTELKPKKLSLQTCILI